MRNQNTGVIDAELVFSDDVEFSAASGNSSELDIGFADPDIGAGGRHLVRAFCNSVAAGTDTGTLTFKLQGSADKSAWSELVSLPVKTSDFLKGGTAMIPLPQECPRYLRMNVVKPSSAATRKMTIDLTAGP